MIDLTLGFTIQYDLRLIEYQGRGQLPDQRSYKGSTDRDEQVLAIRRSEPLAGVYDRTPQLVPPLSLLPIVTVHTMAELFDEGSDSRGLLRCRIWAIIVVSDQRAG